MDRRWLAYALLTATAVALGLLLIRAAFAFVPSRTFEFVTNRLTYVYAFVATALAFLALGYTLGRRIDELWRLSATDSLTGLANHRAFPARLREEWLRVRRYDSPLPLLLVDVDGLKQINEKGGHAAAQHLAQRRRMPRCFKPRRPEGIASASPDSPGTRDADGSLALGGSGARSSGSWR